MSRSAILKLARLVVSAGLIVYLVLRLDLGHVVGHLKALSLVAVALAASLQFAMVVANAIRWRVLLEAKGIRLPFIRLVYYYLVSIFFSSFLPTSVGGDFARIVAVSGATAKRADAFASVVVERLLGFFVLLPVGLASIPFVSKEVVQWRLILSVGLVALVVFVGLYLVLLRPVARWLSRVLAPILGLLGRFRAKERLEKAYEAIVGYRVYKRALSLGFMLSVVSRLLWIVGCYIIAKGLGLQVGFAALFLVVPIVELVRMVPISVGGVGVREWAFVTMLGQFGVEGSLSFALSVVVYVVFFGIGLVGGVLYGTRQFVTRT